MVDTKAVPWNYKRVIVTYKGKEVEEEVNEIERLTRFGRCFTPEELRKAKPVKDIQIPVKKSVTEEEVEESLKRMKMQDYFIIDQLRKTPAQISLLSFLIHSDEHHRALMKIFNEVFVPDKIMVNHLEKIATKIFEANWITFSDNELPIEGTQYNRALYLTVKCEDSIVSRVLVDNGSSANICPLSTLQKLKIGERIHVNSVCVRGFDGGGKDSIGDVMLELLISPVEFTMEFQVLDVAVSYNLLLGMPWIHADKKIVVRGDEKLSAYNDTTVIFIEVEDDKGPWFYQTFEMVSGDKIPEGECIPGPKLSSASVMVANEMLKNDFEPSKEKDVKKARNLKHKVWSLPKPIPHISKSFVKPEASKCPISSVPKPVVDFDKELIKWFQGLFDEVNMVEFREGSSKVDVQKPKPNLNETEAINLEDQDNVRKTKHKLRKFKTDMSVKFKEEITKQLGEKVIRVTQYLTWLANVVTVPKNDGKTRVCVNYHNLNKASPKDNFPLPNIHILINNCAKHEIGSFMDYYAGYHQILMDEEDAEKIAFIMPWGTYCYRIMPFGLKNAGKTYMRVMTTIFHDMIHKEIEVYVDDMIINSRKQSDHVRNLRKIFQRLRRYNLKLNPAKCAFGVPSGKLLGFIVSRCGIKLDPLKIKVIQELPPPKNKAEVMSLLRRLNYISRFIAQLMTTLMHIDEDDHDEKPGWKLFFDGATNMKGVRTRAILISEIGHHYPVTAQLQFYCTNNMANN
ncbi:uncharacterized protein [Nicotiana sylvestris]|uniref:uncharacterized protein n=1 Tax=Nicotiana sylvestris TaxID=4096 RepID=UPI00388C780F